MNYEIKIEPKNSDTQDYKKKESDFLEYQKHEREAFYTGVALYKMRDEFNERLIQQGMEPLPVDEFMSHTMELLKEELEKHEP